MTRWQRLWERLFPYAEKRRHTYVADCQWQRHPDLELDDGWIREILEAKRPVRTPKR